MAPSTNKTYRIRSHSGSGKYLNVYGNDQVSANRNVCLWTLDTSAQAQKWNVMLVSTGVYKITTAIDSSYALNYYWTNGLGNPGNCDIYPHAGNADSTVEFIADANNPDVYEIRLTRSGTDLYLTADSSSTYITDNTNVSWKARNNDWSQKWKFEDINGNTDGELIYSNCHVLGFKGHGRCMNIYTSSIATDGSPISMYDWDNHTDQIWNLRQIGVDNSGATTFVLESGHGGLYLGYTGVSYHGYKSCNLTNNINNALIVAEIFDESRDIYLFRMNINGSNHYLTATAGTTGSRLIWFEGLRNSDQLWTFTTGTSHPQTHPSPTYNFAWPGSNSSLVNDGYDGIWRLYTDDPDITKDHDGVDIPVGNGYCYSMFDGTVVGINTSLSTPRGRYVMVKNDDYNIIALYQHLSSISVAIDDKINKGDIIGIIGGTGTSENQYPVHLHFEIQNVNTDTDTDDNNVRNTTDPLIYF